MVVILSLAAALCYAVASVLQQRAAEEQPGELSMRPALVLRLFRHPVWLAGRVIDSGGYAMQAAALHAGSLVVVEPLLSVGLLFALPLGMIGTHRRMGRREWVGALVLTAGLAAFVALTPRAHGGSSAPAVRWIVTLVGIGAVCGAFVRLARGQPSSRRAALLAVAGGCLFALIAALTKGALAHWSEGLLHLATRWELYALIVLAVVGTITIQSAFHAGPLAASLPALTATEPLVSGVLGVTLFHEHLVRRPVFAAPLLVALAAIGFGIVVLGRSPLVASAHGTPEPEELEFP